VITDDALMAFVDWCRMNHGRFVYDPVLVRRVFNAYAGLPDLPATSKDDQDLELLRAKLANLPATGAG
jgi:hypothetical protein